MKDTLSFNRLGLFIKKNWVENKKVHLFSLLAYSGILIAVYLFQIASLKGSNVLNDTTQIMTFAIGWIVTSILYALQYFTVLQKKTTGTAFIMLPVSQFEKILCAIFYCTILVSVVTIGLFLIINTCMIGLFNSIAEHDPIKYGSMFINGEFVARRLANVAGNKNLINVIIIYYFFFHSSALLGSIYFKERSFVKTIVAVFIILFLLALIQNVVLYALMPMQYKMFDFTMFKTSNYNINVEGEYTYTPAKYISVPKIIAFLNAIIAYCIYPILIVAAYFRLKEKQV